MYKHKYLNRYNVESWAEEHINNIGVRLFQTLSLNIDLAHTRKQLNNATVEDIQDALKEGVDGSVYTMLCFFLPTLVVQMAYELSGNTIYYLQQLSEQTCYSIYKSQCFEKEKFVVSLMMNDRLMCRYYRYMYPEILKDLTSEDIMKCTACGSINTIYTQLLCHLDRSDKRVSMLYEYNGKLYLPYYSAAAKSSNNMLLPLHLSLRHSRGSCDKDLCDINSVLSYTLCATIGTYIRNVCLCSFTDDDVLRHIGMLNDVEEYKDNLLCWCATNGYMKCVEYLMSIGADQSIYTYLPLRNAAIEGNEAMVKYLVEQGADIHAMNDAALRECLINGHLSLAEYIFNHDPNITIDLSYVMMSIIKPDIFRMQDIVRGAALDYNNRLIDGWAVTLQTAEDTIRYETVMWLLEHGADPCIHDGQMIKYLDSTGQYEMTELLVAYTPRSVIRNDVYI